MKAKNLSTKQVILFLLVNDGIVVHKVTLTNISELDAYGAIGHLANYYGSIAYKWQIELTEGGLLTITDMDIL